MAILDVFDRTRIIHLPDRHDRRRGLERELARVGLRLGGDGVDLHEAVRPHEPGPFPSLGARGCFESHLAVLRQARDAGAQALLVLEDDVAFEAAWTSDAAAIATALRTQPWDLVWLGHRLAIAPGTGGAALHRHHGDIVTAHAYGVRGAVLGDLVAFLEQVLARPAGHPDGGPMHVDGALSTYRARRPALVTQVAVPSLVGQRSSRSDITPRWFDRVVGVRQAIATLRVGRRLLRPNRSSSRR